MKQSPASIPLGSYSPPSSRPRSPRCRVPPRLPPIPFVPTSPEYVGTPATPDRVRGVPAHAAQSVHGAQRDARDPRRRVADRRVHVGGPARALAAQLSKRSCATAARSPSTAAAAWSRSASVCPDPSCTCLTPTRWRAGHVLAAAAPGRAENLFQDFTGGGYFYLDTRPGGHLDDTRHIYVIAETRGRAGLQARPRLRPQQGAALERGDHLGAPDPARVAVVRGQDRRRRAARSTSSTGASTCVRLGARRRRRDRELVRQRRRTAASTSPPTASSTASRPGAAARRRSSGRSRIPTAASTSPARSTTAPAPRRR